MHEQSRSVTYTLSTPAQYLKGVGPKLSEKLKKLGIVTIEDLLHYYPRAWEDRRQLHSIKELRPELEMTFKGIIRSVHFLETNNRIGIVSATIEDGTGHLLCKWIRKLSFRYDVFYSFKKDLKPGNPILVNGKITKDFAGFTMMVNEYEVLAQAQENLIHIGRIVPLYPGTEGIQTKFIRTLIYRALLEVELTDPTPKNIQNSYHLMPLDSAFRKIHFPKNFEEKEDARKRLAFQEFFYFQTVLSLVKQKRQVSKIASYIIKKHLLTPFKEKCGFEFTLSQKKVIREIFNDLLSEKPMNRLLQGDVGSGKTIVALSAILLACENKLQAALMAPTEILAEQHYITIKHFLKSLPVNLELLTSSTKKSKRQKLLKECAEGKMDIVIGTHALLEKELQFKKCGMVVIDEQHRFGVKHRLILSNRNPAPDVLVMTATPIPRTLAQSLYGDLDVSIIDELPPGRQKIETLWKKEQDAYEIVKTEIEKGHQAYIVYPLVDESDKIELKSAIKEFQKLKNETFKGTALGLLHGQMKGSQKESVMKDFYSGKFSILVTTTIIEVGIDVPNATVMVIENAERFGLATLHQLRGRVGRGGNASCCIVIANPKTEESKKRIEIFLKNQNGFELAEADLAIRGPGEIFGTSQHGAPNFKIADFSIDQDLLEPSQKAAKEILLSDPSLIKKDHLVLKEELRKIFSKTWVWATIA